MGEERNEMEDDEKDDSRLLKALRRLNPFRTQVTPETDERTMRREKLSGAALEVSQSESVFISVSNVLIVIVIIADLLFFTEFVSVNLPLLTIANLFILALAFTSYLVKRRILRRALRKK